MPLSKPALELLAAEYALARGFGLSEANARLRASVRCRIKDASGNRVDPITCAAELREYIKGQGSKVLELPV